MLSKSQIITAITQIKSPVVILTEGRHQNATLVLLAEREIAKWHGYRQRQVLEDHIGRTSDHIFLGFDLCLGQLEIEVRMLMVITCRVTAILDIVVVIFGLLGNATREETLALLGHDVGDKTALGFEVVFHQPRLILTAVVLEHR